MFVDVNKFKGSLGYDYRFLGVVTGEVYESNDLTLQTAATYKGNLASNSDISIVVPSDEVKKLLSLPSFKAYATKSSRTLFGKRNDSLMSARGDTSDAIFGWGRAEQRRLQGTGA